MKKILNIFSVLLVLISTNVYSGQDFFDEVMEYRIGSEIDETRFDKEIQDDGSIKYILKEHKIPNTESIYFLVDKNSKVTNEIHVLFDTMNKMEGDQFFNILQVKLQHKYSEGNFQDGWNGINVIEVNNGYLMIFKNDVSLAKIEDMVVEQRQIQIRMKYVFINEYEDIITRYF